MELEFKEDFDGTRKNWSLFWEGRLGRPIILAVAPKAGMDPVSPPRWGEALYREYEDIADQALRWAESHEFLCDSVPFFTPSLMTGFLPALLGAEIKITQESWGADTSVVPFIDDIGGAEIKFDRNSKFWEMWLRLCGCLKRKLAGKMIFGEMSVLGCLDTLAELKDKTSLMTDFFDNPDGVHRALQQTLAAHHEIADEFERIFEFGKFGGVTRHGFYADGVIGVPQCDFGFNIGKEHFDEFALPYLKKEMERLDAVEYHLDGPGNITHVESICGIEKIDVVQWVPGVNNEKKDWTALYERINALGKGLWLWASSPEEALGLWRKYHSPGKLILSVSVKDKKEAIRYMEVFEKSS
jgi:5-methyltetrahydrofolate--homocysteine methyltransferase